MGAKFLTDASARLLRQILDQYEGGAPPGGGIIDRGTLYPRQPEFIWARLDSGADAGPWTWAEQEYLGAGVFADLAGGRSGDKVYLLNGLVGEEDAIVQIWPSIYVPDEWLCTHIAKASYPTEEVVTDVECIDDEIVVTYKTITVIDVEDAE